MKKGLWIFIFFSLFLCWQCKKNDDEPPPPQIDLNEGQNNWTKQIVAQRPTGDIPSDPYGSFCPVEVIPLFFSGDTITFFVNFYKTIPYLSVFISYQNAQSFFHKITFDGNILSCDQSDIFSFSLRKWNNTTYIGKALHYGTSWNWQPATFNATQIVALTKDTLFLLDNNSLKISYNGGQQWSIISSNFYHKIYKFGKEIWLTKDSNVYVLTNPYTTPQWISKLPHLITSLYKHDTLLLAGTEKGKIYVSTNGGTTWEKKFDGTSQYGQNQKMRIEQFIMLDGWNGFALLVPDGSLYYSSNYPSVLSLILRTTDGGTNWQVNYVTQLIKLKYFTRIGQKIIACGYQPAHPTISGIYFIATTTMGN
ncbi:MAG: hypothetical protein N2Z72_08695 [Bacteroidales bacterium]|nr:hypothetical protein [Bacteroidales bacterium]